ncbi:MAG: hypothetical protein WAL98_11340 [Desulfatiglandaceae bacterium]
MDWKLRAGRTMDAENISVKNRLEDETKASLSELKDWIVLLDMAGEYLCDGLVFQKMAMAIQKSLEVLKKRSEELKEQFVGRPLHDIDIDEPLEKLSAFSNRLGEADDHMNSHCREGKVARELEDRLDFLKQRLNALKDRVDGQVAPYGAGDSLDNILVRLKTLSHLLVSTYKKATRISLAIFLIGLIAFVSLFATMESQTAVLKEIQTGRSLIRSTKARLADIQAREDKLHSKTTRMELYVMTREDKISILELDLRSHKLNEQKEKIQAELDLQEKTLDRNVNKLEAMRRKSFLARLFRL